jgi:protein-tyrosine phosphatase
MENNSTPGKTFIDLHAHIVPGVDDGAESFDEALEMLRMAEADGVAAIVATPHVFSAHNTVKEFEIISRRIRDFHQQVKQSGLNINVLPGAEVFFTADLLEYLAKYQDILTLNHSSYFLLEFPFEFIFPGTRDFIFNVLTEGWIPVIVHPERNHAIQRSPAILYDWVKLGVLVQVNAGSLKGIFGSAAQETAFRLLYHNLVHVIASDAHSPNHRPPLLSFVPALLKNQGIENADFLVHHIPRAILEDKAVPDTGEPLDPQKKTKFFDFLKGIFK